MERYREAATVHDCAVLPFFAWFPSHSPKTNKMDCFGLTRALVDIESTTGHEKPVVDFLHAYLSKMARRHNGRIERMTAAPERDNLLLTFGEPVVTLSTHMDTVPPYWPSSEDSKCIRGRGSCDAKGIIAAMITAAESLLESGTRNFALLFVVGEERDSAGAQAAAGSPQGSQFLINGEPTQNRLALGSKGALRYEVMARGKLAHSAYPELGHSAIDSLLNALSEIRAIPLPSDPVLGSATLNIGTIQGGRAPNVVADGAQAELMFRIVGDAEALRKEVARVCAGHNVEAREVFYCSAVRLGSMEDLPTTIVAFTTDIPTFNGTWGKPFLIGPGSIHDAHTAEERIDKKELADAVEIYAQMVRQLLTAGVAAQ